jgi:nucleotide-binding universal stress UspA family protein
MFTPTGTLKRRMAMTPETASTLDTEGSPGRIVVGIDGSAASIEALAWAGRQAHLTQATLELSMTWDWPTTYGWAPLPEGYDPSEGMPEILAKAAGDLRAKYPDIEITTRLAQGHPAPLLVEASNGADLLVVGSRGHGEFVGMLIGSVSEYCVTNAQCPVLVHRVVA